MVHIRVGREPLGRADSNTRDQRHLALKVFLEHDIEPNFVVDHAPDALTEGWTTHRAAGSNRS